MKRFRLAAAATCVVMLLAFWVRADVLEQIPADALMVVKVNNLKGTSDKFAKLAADLGLAQMAPDQMKDPLAFVQQQMQMSNGVNTAGDLGFAVLNPETSGVDEDESIVVLIPVSDYQAFIGNWTEAKTEGDVSEVTLGPGADTGYVANWGSYAAISPNRQIVANKPANAGVKFPAATAKELATKDAVLVGNFNALRSKLMPKIKESREEVIADMEQHMASDPNAAKFTPLARSVVNQLMNGVEAFLRDTEAASVGLSFAADGINLTVLSDFSAGSYLGQTFGATKQTGEEKLAGLPAGKYMFYAGSVADPQHSLKVIEDMLGPIVQEAIAVGPEFKAAGDYYEGLKAYVGSATSGAFGLMAPTGAPGTDPLIQGLSIQQGDAQAMREGYKKMMTSQQELMKALGMPEEQWKVTYTPAAKTVDGVSFDSLQSSVSVGDPNDPSTAMAQQVIDMFYGPGGMNLYLGTFDGTLMTAMGVKDETISAAITAVKGKAAPLSETAGVKAVAAHLPKQNSVVFFVQLDEIVNTGLTYARQFHFNIPVQLPPDLPPIGGAISTEGSALRCDVHVPTQLVQSLVAAGLQAAMQMRGGPGGGGL